MRIGITERGDAALDQSWRNKLHTVDGAILVTKAPHKLGVVPNNCIVHCTITGLGNTAWEPNVAPPRITLDAYNYLVDVIGPERTVLRIDPITAHHFDLAKAVIEKAISRVRISFLDCYNHVRERVRTRIPQEVRQLPDMHYTRDQRTNMLRSLSKIYSDIEICGEPGMINTGCVSKRDLVALGLPIPDLTHTSKQRYHCNCIAAKTELLNNRKPCTHNCVYCYWKG